MCKWNRKWKKDENKGGKREQKEENYVKRKKMFRYLKYCGINPLGEPNLARERDIYVKIDRYIYI